jgi:hypothetical protein
LGQLDLQDLLGQLDHLHQLLLWHRVRLAYLGHLLDHVNLLDQWSQWNQLGLVGQVMRDLLGLVDQWDHRHLFDQWYQHLLDRLDLLGLLHQ